MPILSNLVHTVVGDPSPVVPAVFIIETRLRDAVDAQPALAAALAQARFEQEMFPSPQTGDAVAQAQTNLTVSEGRVASLRDALGVAQARSAQEADQQAAADHARAVKALTAHLTTIRRKGKNLSGHLDAANREFTTMLAAVEEVTRVWPKACGVRMPHAEVTGLVQIQTMIRNEIVRLIATADPSAFTRIGNHHRNFMTVRDSQDGQIAGLRRTGGPETLPSMEHRMAQAAQSLVNTAKANPPKAVSWSAPRLAAAVYEPIGALPNKVKSADIPNLAELKQLHAADMAEQMAATPPEWNAADIEQQKAEWAALNAAEPEAEGDYLTAALDAWKQLNPHGEDADALAEMQAAAQTDKEPIQ